MWYAPRSPLIVGWKFDTTTSPASVSARSLPTSSGGSGTQPRQASRATLPVPTRSKSSTASRASVPDDGDVHEPAYGCLHRRDPVRGEAIARRRSGAGRIAGGRSRADILRGIARRPQRTRRGERRHEGDERTSRAVAPAHLAHDEQPGRRAPASTSSGFVKPQIVPSVPSGGAGSHAPREPPPHPSASDERTRSRRG